MKHAAPSSPSTRRAFLQKSALAGAAVAFPAMLRGSNLNGRVQLAAIGRTRGVATTDESPNRKYEGMRVADAAKAAGKDPFDFVFDLLVATRGSVA